MSCEATIWTTRIDRNLPDEHRCELNQDGHDWHRCHCRFAWTATEPLSDGADEGDVP